MKEVLKAKKDDGSLKHEILLRRCFHLTLANWVFAQQSAPGYVTVQGRFASCQIGSTARKGVTTAGESQAYKRDAEAGLISGRSGSLLF